MPKRNSHWHGVTTMNDRRSLEIVSARLRIEIDKMLNGWAFWFFVGTSLGGMMFWQ